MSDNHSELQRYRTQLPTNDGWDDAAREAGERQIQGTLLKFADWRWTAGREARVLEHGTRLVALATAAGWVRWENGKPAEYRMREKGRRLPEREELGHTDQSEWEQNFRGEATDPWQSTRFVQLIDPATAEAYTFSTSSWGGRSAVADLGDQIMRMRTAHPGAVPIVELQAAEMATKFGRKSKPVFKVVGWKRGGDDDGALPTEGPQPTQAKRAQALLDSDDLEPPSRQREMDDSIPF
jgi:hypothetical protein